MTDKEKALNHLYDLVADELSISPSRLDAAISGYTAVGEWLGGGIDNLTHYASRVYEPRNSYKACQ